MYSFIYFIYLFIHSFIYALIQCLFILAFTFYLAFCETRNKMLLNLQATVFFNVAEHSFCFIYLFL